jgi:hypothetical protein
MPIRAWTRALEKRFLRPLGRILPGRGRGGSGGRIGRLERRIDDLEAMVRELSGVVYLEMDQRQVGDAPRAGSRGGTPAADTREAA